MPLFGEFPGLDYETTSKNGEVTTVLKSVRAKTEGQKRYLRAIKENRLIFCLGPAGTGKSHLACGFGATAFKKGGVEQIIMVRPAVGAGDPVGFLPGTAEEKIAPYLRPLVIETSKFFTPTEFKKLRSGDKPAIVIELIDFMRGRTFNNSFIIVDESQNCTFEQLKMIITRMGNNTTIVINGDASQSDLHPNARGALVDFANRWTGRIVGVETVEMTADDIVRDAFLKELMLNWDPPKDDVRNIGGFDVEDLDDDDDLEPIGWRDGLTPKDEWY